MNLSNKVIKLIDEIAVNTDYAIIEVIKNKVR